MTPLKSRIRGGCHVLCRVYSLICHIYIQILVQLPVGGILGRQRDDIRVRISDAHRPGAHLDDPDPPSPCRLVPKIMNCQQKRPKEEHFRCASEGFRFLTSDLSQGYILMFTRFPDNSNIYQLSPMQARQSPLEARLWSRRRGTIWNRQAGTSSARSACF